MDPASLESENAMPPIEEILLFPSVQNLKSKGDTPLKFDSFCQLIAEELSEWRRNAAINLEVIL